MKNLTLPFNDFRLPLNFYAKKFEKEIKNFQIIHVSKAEQGWDKNKYVPLNK